MMTLDNPYTEPNLPSIQQNLREKIDSVLVIALDQSKILNSKSKLLGFADNGISAVIAILKSTDRKYAVKIKPKSGDLEIMEFLTRNKYQYSVEIFESFEIQFESTTFSVSVMEYVESERASHAELNDTEMKNCYRECGIALKQLHEIEVVGFGEIKVSPARNIIGEDDLETALSELFGEDHIQLINKIININPEPRLLHHALGLHNTFWINNSVKLFDFKSVLLPKEFDIAMFIIWNEWRGEEFMDEFYDGYGDDFNTELLNIALFLEYTRKLETWRNRLANNPKVKDWIIKGEKEISRLKSII